MGKETFAIGTFFSNIWIRLTYKTVYHVAPQSAVASIAADVNPGYNIWAQYGQGFYTFAKRRDALKWQHLRPKLLDIQEEHVTLEFRIPRDVWRRFRRKQVPDFYNWRIPQDWIREFDILESTWGVTPETRSLKNAKQYKFNPNTYEILDASLVR